MPPFDDTESMFHSDSFTSFPIYTCNLWKQNIPTVGSTAWKRKKWRKKSGNLCQQKNGVDCGLYSVECVQELAKRSVAKDHAVRPLVSKFCSVASRTALLEYVFHTFEKQLTKTGISCGNDVNRCACAEASVFPPCGLKPSQCCSEWCHDCESRHRMGRHVSKLQCACVGFKEPICGLPPSKCCSEWCHDCESRHRMGRHVSKLQCACVGFKEPVCGLEPSKCCSEWCDDCESRHRMGRHVSKLQCACVGFKQPVCGLPPSQCCSQWCDACKSRHRKGRHVSNSQCACDGVKPCGLPQERCLANRAMLRKEKGSGLDFDDIELLLAKGFDLQATLDEKAERIKPMSKRDLTRCINEFVSNTYDLSNCKIFPCAVCGVRYSKGELSELKLGDKNSTQLKRNKQKEVEYWGMVRDLKTRTYCQFKNITYILNAQGVDMINGLYSACNNCVGSLENGNIPYESYYRLDPGPRPVGLPVLTFIESMFLSKYRVSAFVYRIVVGQNNKAREIRGNAVAYCRPDISSLFKEKDDGSSLICQGMDKIVDNVRIICLSQVSSVQEARELVSRCNDLKVRVSVLKQWFHYLNEVQGKSEEFDDSWLASEYDNEEELNDFKHNEVPKVLLMSITKANVNLHDAGLDKSVDSKHQGYDKSSKSHVNVVGDDDGQNMDSDGSMKASCTFIINEQNSNISAMNQEKPELGAVLTNVNRIMSDYSAGYFYQAFTELFLYGWG